MQCSGPSASGDAADQDQVPPRRPAVEPNWFKDAPVDAA
jgi:hypothetical protein